MLASEELNAERAAIQGKITLLSFSRGKDSIGAWLALRECFDYIIPVFLYLIPGLEFEEESLQYYENFFGTRIIRLPHPSAYRLITNMIYQVPQRRVS